ncbi:hypothetical protein B296_00053729 [Ensete ventricosum]|uniref:Uncharacterized protein n=1 Tax=Ensete ventricosum TaxID=4639 RepID=A0A426X8H4_ENSVE|nr:hypothetical protein B296_00053729 [Ensete ventricosum]
MIKYLTKACRLIGAFRHFTITKVSRTDNTHADTLAWLASARGYEKEYEMANLFRSTISTPELATTNTIGSMRYSAIRKTASYTKIK